jgi:biotin transport system substrate-specific component
MNLALTHTGSITFRWIDELTVPYKLALAFSFACLTGIMAQIRIPLPFTPVPLTGQVFAVLFSAVFLGGLYGGLSQILYLVFGAIGVPWFSGGIGGMAYIAGITGGYLIGFIPAVLLVGWFTSRFVSMRKFHFQLLLMMIGVVTIYIFGATQIAVVMHTGFIDTIKLAVLPFIAVDLMKSAIVACISASILPKDSKI